jgi:hypothetical protein
MARVTGVYSRNFNTARLLTIARPYDAYNVPITRPDPGPDGSLSTPDDPGRSITFYEFPVSLRGAAFETSTVITDPNGNHTYKTIEMAAGKRMSRNWQFSASYSATKKNIPFGVSTPPLAYNPTAEIFVADNTWEWNAKASGAYQLPYEIIGSVNFEHRSGDPGARQVLFTGGVTIPSIVLNVEPIGSIRTPNVNMLDLRLDKRFRFGANRSLGVRVDVFNAMNIDTLRTWVVRSGSTYLQPVSQGNNNATAIIPPRLVMFGLSYNF